MSNTYKQYLNPKTINKIDNLFLRAKLVVEGFIIGMLKIITITPPIAKFLLFKRFIEPEIEASIVKTGEPRRKVIRIK